ncbi:hypothetical protein DD237_008041 [Peronospora effusa]|uniref:Reverse transcriptase Ty1/copia-type domain-containing protein n=1 Tax=Peronospora effusa TaxID=542832 RepID=A0A3R7W8L0_9STRA|nr:hypothetical protein DD237_008041 [Peronospora effusa]
MELNNMKVILIINLIWKVPARHGNVSNAYPKAETEGNYEHLQIPKGIEISSDKMDELGLMRYKLLQKTLINTGLMQCLTDTCIFARIEDCGMVLTGFYVDD